MRQPRYELNVEEFPVEEFAHRLMAWGPSAFQRYPWRKKLPLWKGLLVEVMLQRTRADQVVPSFTTLDSRFRTAASLGDMNESEARALIEPLGLAWRIPLFLQLCRELARRKGRLPRIQSAIEKLPGVGPYAAGAALSLHGNTRALVIDSNVVRVICRVLGVPFDGETRRKSWIRELLDGMTPETDFKTFNYAVIDLAIQICRPRNPRCYECPVQTVCATGMASSSTSGS